MTSTKQKLMTADELLRLPRGEGKRYELIRGVLIEKMPTGDLHGDSVSSRFTILIFGITPKKTTTALCGPENRDTDWKEARTPSARQM